MRFSVAHRLCLAVGAALVTAAPAFGEGEPVRGAQVARACFACHSFTPGQHLTGPSLAGVFGRRAGTAPGYERYSDALKKSRLVWDREHLDAWLRNPAALVPGNAMGFAGIADAAARADLIAWLEALSTGQATPPKLELPDLKQAQAAARVEAVQHCGDGYRVTTADGKTRTFWEFNLRFKTDGSARGPLAGKPVIVGNGMQGDRASIVFARPAEISGFLQAHCP